MVLGAWLISIGAASFYIPYSQGVNADPEADDLDNRKGGCNINFPDDSWWEVMQRFQILSLYVKRNGKLSN